MPERRTFTWSDETLEIRELERWGERGRGWVLGNILVSISSSDDKLARGLLQTNIDALRHSGWSWVPPGSNLILSEVNHA